MRLLLVDGHYQVYRAFHAIKGLKNSRGEPTNAIYGFVNTLRRMQRDLRAEYGAVVWDAGLPERRTQLEPGYKQQRPEMPEPMRPQIDAIRELAPLLGFRSVSLDGTEADDLMASYAVAAERKGWESVLATNDKDLFQVVTDRIRVYSTNKADVAGAANGYVLLGPADVEKKWGVPPGRIRDTLALAGDTADNIPGIPGVGIKGASSLVREMGGVDAIFDKIESVRSERIRDKLREHEEQVRRNLEMVRLDCDLALPVPLEGLRVQPHWAGLIEKLEGFEFQTLVREIRKESAGEGEDRAAGPRLQPGEQGEFGFGM